jgi:transcriptional regulator with XRE-family HTH domain
MQTEIIAGDVRSRRLAAGLSQLELAERAGCAESTIRLFDRGYTPARSEALPRVLAVLEGAEADPSREAA